MQKFVFFIFFLGIISLSINTAKADRNTKVAVGDFHACAIDDDGVKCWGDNSFGQSNAPVLANPTAITAGAWHTCAIDNRLVKCWGRNHDGQLNVPSLKNPKAISAGYTFTCALDEDEIICWGNEKEDSYALKSFNDFIDSTKNTKIIDIVSNNQNDICAIPEKESEVYCKEGFIEYDKDYFRLTDKPKKVSIGQHFGCAILENSTVECWGLGGGTKLYEFIKKMPKLVSPSEIAVGKNFACVIDLSLLKCWGGPFEPGLNNFPAVENYKTISANLYQVCFGDERRLGCLGPSKFRHMVPTLNFPNLLNSSDLKKPAKLTVLGSKIKFKKDFFIDANKNTMLIGNSQSIQCSLVAESQASSVRKISAGKRFVISKVELNIGARQELVFSFNDTPTKILCDANSSDVISFDAVISALNQSGLDFGALALPGPVEL